MNTQPEFHLPWIDRRYSPSRTPDAREVSDRGLVGDDAPGLRAVKIERRILGLKMVQDVCYLNDERRSEPLGRANLLREGCVERPGRKTSENAGSAARRVQTEDRTPEQSVCCSRIAEYVQTRPASSGAAIHSHPSRTRNIVMQGIPPVYGPVRTAFSYARLLFP
jgi:hypothetical protein